MGRKISREEYFAGGKFREIPFAVDIIFAGGKFRATSNFANIAKISSTRKIGVIQYPNRPVTRTVHFDNANARPANRPAFGGTVPLFYHMSRVPLNHGNVPLFVRSRIIIFYARAICNAAAVLAKIPNGIAAESPCYSVSNAIDFCRLYRGLLLKKSSMWALPTVPLFSGKSRFFTRNVPLKTFSRLAGQ